MIARQVRRGMTLSVVWSTVSKATATDEHLVAGPGVSSGCGTNLGKRQKVLQGARNLARQSCLPKA